MREYWLDTVTYGLTCAPYLVIRTLRQLASDEEILYSRGASVLRSDCYIDDILQEAREIQEELTLLCAADGFPLRKWTANTDALLEGIPLDHQQQRSPPIWE